MTELRRILCPVDFSEHSRRALDYALAIAHRYDSAITLLYVYDVPAFASYGPEPQPLELLRLSDRDRGTLMHQLKTFLESETTVAPPVTFAVVEDDTTAAILNAAAADDADLLVLGTHGRSGVRRLVLGSVAEKVLRRATCPVLSVPPRVPDAVPAAPGLFKRIVCAMDFSECSMRALHYAMALAQEADARLTVLHAAEYGFDELPPDVRASSPGNLPVAEFRRQCEEESRRRLQAAIPEAVRTYGTVDVTVSSQGKPYEAILRVARGQMADVIVMGVRGRSAADVAFFGSTTQHVVRQATCPVLTLRGE